MTAMTAIQPGVPSYIIGEDHDAGIVRMRVEGFFDLDTLSRHFTEQAAIVARWRACGRPIRMLLDAVDLMPHAPEGQALVEHWAQRIFRSGDRFAVIVSSNLVKMQMRRATPENGIIDFFVSEHAALAWLMACE